MSTWLIRERSCCVAAALLALFAAAGCFSSGDRPDRTPPPPPAAVQIDLTVHEQRIDGFGASSAWTANNIPDSEADLLFSPTALLTLVWLAGFYALFAGACFIVLAFRMRRLKQPG